MDLTDHQKTFAGFIRAIHLGHRRIALAAWSSLALTNA